MDTTGVSPAVSMVRNVGDTAPVIGGLRRFGAACLDLAYVAAGRFDAFWERGLMPWDMAAGLLLVREAGGIVSDLDGRDRMLATGHVLAGNSTLHRRLLALLAKPAAP